MRYLKTFESFNINETMDMMFMPVDPIAGAADVYNDIYSDLKSFLKDKFNQFEGKLEEAIDSILPKIDGEKAMENARKFFGKDPLSLTSEDIKLVLSEKLSLTNESWMDKYDEADPYGSENSDTPLKDVKGGLIHKIGNLLQNIFVFNLLSMGFIGSFLTWLFTSSGINPVMSMVVSMIAWLVIHIIRKIAATINPVK